MSKAVAHRAETGGEFGDREYFDPVRIFCARLPYAIELAQNLRLEALAQSKEGRVRRAANHRNFYAGAVGVGVNPLLRSDHLVPAINTMPVPAGARVCAEKRVNERFKKINRAEGGGGWLVGLVVVGEPQEDGATGNDPETLWPCGETCLPGVIRRLRRDMLVVTGRPDKRKGQVQTGGEMDDYYKAFIAKEHPSEPFLFHQPEEDGWTGVIDRYDAIVSPSMNVLESPETYAFAVEAARTAIEIAPRRLRSV